ncbi:MAG: hypothetical protein JXB07_07405 [Anaerolineae bacterium]|nr:hypothetical protein [Anaerolineae bacterium]
MKYIFSSPLTVEDCIDRLHKELDKPVELFSTQRPRPVTGKVQDHRFVIRVNRHRNHMALYGALAPSPRGTTIEGDYRVRTFVKVFLAIWTASGTFLFCSLGLAATFGLSMFYNMAPISDPVVDELRTIISIASAIGFGGSLFWLLFGIGMFLLCRMSAGFPWGKEDLERVLTLLENTLEAQRVEQDPAN